MVAKYSIEGRRPTTSLGLRSIPERIVFPIRTRVSATSTPSVNLVGPRRLFTSKNAVASSRASIQRLSYLVTFDRLDFLSKLFREGGSVLFANDLFLHWDFAKNADSILEGRLERLLLRFAEQKV